MDLSPVEIRVLGALLEKQRTTPDAYPLTLNALRLACNQSTNRDPVVDYDEETIRAALDRLHRRGFTRLTSTHGSRASKFRQLFDGAVGLEPDELAVLCVLMLRGPQTPGELKQRSDRLHSFDGLDAVQATLGRLIERDLVARMERRPGQKEERYAHRLGDDSDPPPEGPAPAAPPQGSDPGSPVGVHPSGGLAERVEQLEARVAALEAELSSR